MPDAPFAPAASRANKKARRVSLTTGSPDHRHSLRNGFTAYSTLSPAIGLVVTVANAMREHRRRLDASVEASGPHGFAVREYRIRLLRHARPPHLLPHVL
jgi:hypothetical protein